MNDQIPPYGESGATSGGPNQPYTNPNQPYPPAQENAQSYPPAQGNAWGAPTPPPMPGGGAGMTTGVRPAELGDRFLAKIIDWIALIIVNVIVVFVIVVGVILGPGSSGFAVSAVTSIIGAAITWGYFAFMESSQGATLGKMALKLKVVGATGEKPTLEEALRRNAWCGLSLIGIIPIIGSLIGGLATLVAVIMIAVGISQDTTNRQAWHDKFAGGTRVLKVG